jgi:hypothetical protein
MLKTPLMWGVLGLLVLFMVYVSPRFVAMTVFTGGFARGTAILAGLGCLAYAAVLFFKRPPAV